MAFALFGRAIEGEYVLDGVAAVRDNPLLSPFEPLRIASLDWWAGTGKPGGLYRPVALLWLAALRALGGGAPTLINLGNVALHASVAWLRCDLLLRLLGPGRRSLMVACLAAAIALVHPLGVEVVAGQVGAADLLATALGTAAVIVAADGSRRRWIAGAALTALGVLAKESAVVVVPLAVLFQWLRSTGSTARFHRTLAALSWSSAGVAIAVACRYAAIGSIASVDDPVYAGFSSAARMASACAAFATYSLPLVVAPWRQLAVVSYQDVAPVAGFADLRALAGAGLVLALMAAPLLAVRRGRREIAFGLWLFVAAWLPTSNLFFSSGALVASRFLYAGLIGLALIVASATVEAWPRGPGPRMLAGTLVSLFGVLMPILSLRELSAWKTEQALLEAQVARAPSSSYALVDLATLLRERDPARAARLLAAASALSLPSVPGSPYPPEDLLESAFIARTGAAQLAQQRGDASAAESEFRAAEALAARGIEASGALPYRENWRRHRAFALRQEARIVLARAKPLTGAEREAQLDAAERTLRDAEAGDPDSSEWVELRAQALHVRGDENARRALIEEAWRKRPDDPLLRSLWAMELRQLGRNGEALSVEIDIALTQLASVEPARALAAAKEAFRSSDPTMSEKGRRLLLEIAQRSSDRSVAQQAAQLLAAASRPP